MTWYHGTSVEAAQAILANGFIGRAERGRAYLAPLPGRAYLSRRLPFALSYSFGGLVEADADGWRIHGRNPVGAVLAVEPALETCTPDEDWLGNYLVNVDRLDGQPELRRAVRAVMSYIPARTRNGWAQIRDRREYAVWARTGKTAINHLLKTAGGREVLAWLTVLAPEIACVDRTVRVLGAWRLTREQVPQLAPDGSNLDLIGVPIQPAGGLAGRRVIRNTADKPAVLQRDHHNWIHVTKADNVPSIQRHGLLVDPPQRVYGPDDTFATLGGIYVGHRSRIDDLRERFCERFNRLAILHLVLPAGTRYCLDEDVIGDIQADGEDEEELVDRYGAAFSAAGASPTEVGTTLRKAVTAVFQRGRAKYRRARPDRAAADRWSCRLARMLDEDHLDKFFLRLFDPPHIAHVEIVHC